MSGVSVRNAWISRGRISIRLRMTPLFWSIGGCIRSICVQEGDNMDFSLSVNFSENGLIALFLLSVVVVVSVLLYRGLR
jgi:hypothetical protein